MQASRTKVQPYVCDGIQKAVFSQAVIQFLLKALFTGSVCIKYPASSHLSGLNELGVYQYTA